MYLDYDDDSRMAGKMLAIMVNKAFRVGKVFASPRAPKGQLVAMDVTIRKRLSQSLLVWNADFFDQ